MDIIQSIKELCSTAKQERLNKELYDAFLKHNIEQVKALLDAGAICPNGPFLSRQIAQNPEILELLLTKGAVQQDTLNEALYLACPYGSPINIKALLDAGASVNSKEGYGLFAIERAAKNPEVLELFLEKGGVSQEAAKAAGITLPEQKAHSDTHIGDYADAKNALHPYEDNQPSSEE